MQSSCDILHRCVQNDRTNSEFNRFVKAKLRLLHSRNESSEKICKVTHWYKSPLVNVLNEDDAILEQFAESKLKVLRKKSQQCRSTGSKD